MFRKILTAATLILVALVVWGAHDQIFAAVGYLANTNLFFVLLLIPEQLFMYYCAGQMFFSYMAAKARTAQLAKQADKTPAKDQETAAKTSDQPQKVSSWLLARISFELNFVNHAIPSGGFAGLGYITWRLKAFGSSAGQTSFMYALRYVITILANQAQTIVAILVLILVGGVSTGAWWVIGLTSLICVGVILAVAAIIAIASSKKRINWFAKTLTNLANGFVRKVTFGHKRQVLQPTTVETYFLDIYKDLTTAKANKKILIHPIMWGIIYSFLEVATYWLVGISMGHPEILPQIMIAEAVASVIGAVMLTPGGVGGYEGAMILIMTTLGVDASLATAVVITTRIVVLVGTIVSGYGFYQNAISKIGKTERAKIMREVDKK